MFWRRLIFSPSGMRGAPGTLAPRCCLGDMANGVLGRAFGLLLVAGCISTCSSDGVGIRPLIEKPPMATDTDRGKFFDSDSLPTLWGVRLRHEL
jgi:hypothetical protein